jgi:hypothetical protein
MAAHKARRCIRREDGTYKRSPEYASYRTMISRCYDTNVGHFHLYGGRGIKVCDRWRESFDNFLADMGPRPSLEHTLDRINNDGNYEPSNCRWATRLEQARNKRTAVFLTYEGQTMSIAEWARKLEIPRYHITRRLKRGWPIEATLTTPVNRSAGIRMGTAIHKMQREEK